MKVARKLLCALVVVTLLCAMMATTAFAAETGNMWLKVVGESRKTVVTVVADTTVTNGQVELHYNASKLTYTGVTVDDRYVDVYAVNADTPGVIKIAWVAPDAYADNGVTALISLSFTGKSSAGAFSISGSAFDAAGTQLTIVNKDDTGSADTGDSILPVMGLMLLSVSAMAVCLVSKQKGWWAK